MTQDMSLGNALKLGRLDAHDQAGLVRSGDVSALELVDAAILRIESIDSSINSVSWKSYQEARARAAAFKPDEGLVLGGVPYLLKDSMDYPGMPIRAGSALSDARIRASGYALGHAYDRAGLIPVGKSTMPEFALLPSNEPRLWGTTLNPWNHLFSVGGSSGGAAAAVAAGLVPVAHASDGGGSIRLPASCCGIVGLKPGRGWNLRARASNILEDLMVSDSLYGRTVRDVAAGIAIGNNEAPFLPRPPDRRLKIGLDLLSHNGEQPHPSVAKEIETVASLCAELGHQVEECSERIPRETVAAAFRTLWAHIGGMVLDHANAAFGERTSELEPWTRGLGALRDAVTISETEELFRAIGDLPALYASLFERYDVLLTPVTRDPAAAVGVFSPERNFDELLAYFHEYVSYTPAANIAGLASIALPLSKEKSPPIGSLFTAAAGNEGLLLSLAAELQDAVHWERTWPETIIADAASA
jgi:amidase